jgi:hypothetical protein
MSHAAAASLGFLAIALWAAEPEQVQRIVARSVENTNADWSAAPRYNFTERDDITRKGKRSFRTSRVLMIEGSPYNKLLAVNDTPLSPARAALEEHKLQQEIARRLHETAAARQRRVARYERERRQDHELMAEMVEAFTYKLDGEETVDGRRCYVLDAMPKPGYEPKNRETKVLKGMRGKMWIDEQQYQWVKVEAEVFRPVEFGLFIADVEPGTEFVLEQEPVMGNIWLPSHFLTRVRAEILVFSERYTDDETYSQYKQAAESGAALSSARP